MALMKPNVRVKLRDAAGRQAREMHHASAASRGPGGLPWRVSLNEGLDIAGGARGAFERCVRG